MSDNRAESAPTPEEAAQSRPDAETSPARPSMPAPARAMTPEPIEGDDGEIIPAVTPPGQDEILPTTGGIPFAPSNGRPVSPYDRRAASSEDSDDVHRLGQSAVTNASLAVSGAPTPMAGVPVDAVRPSRRPGPAASAETPPFGDGDEPFTPRYEPRTMFTPVSGSSPDEGETSGDDQDAQAPTSGPGVPMSVAIAAMADEQGGTEDDDAPADGEPEADAQVTPRKPRASARVIVLLVLLGIAVWAGAAYAAVLWLSPAAVDIEAEVHVTGPPGPTVDPIELEDPSEFLAAVSLTAGTWALASVEELDPIDAGVPERAVEVYDLQYTDGTDVVTVRAIQHYTSEEAEAAFTALAQDGTDMGDVVDGSGAVVGGSALIEDDESTTIVWRNGTAVFVASGEYDQTLDLYSLFAL